MHRGEPVLHREVSESCSVEINQRICQHEHMVPVAFLAATNAGVVVASMMSTLIPTKSAARSGSRSDLHSAKRDSMITFCSIAQSVPERVNERCGNGGRGVREPTYPVYLPRLLRPGAERLGERPSGCRAAEERDEFAPPHSSASDSVCNQTIIPRLPSGVNFCVAIGP